MALKHRFLSFSYIGLVSRISEGGGKCPLYSPVMGISFVTQWPWSQSTTPMGKCVGHWSSKLSPATRFCWQHNHNDWKWSKLEEVSWYLPVMAISICQTPHLCISTLSQGSVAACTHNSGGKCLHGSILRVADNVFCSPAFTSKSFSGVHCKL